MFNVFFRTLEGKNDYEVVFSREKAYKRMDYYNSIGCTNVRIGIR